MKAFFWSLFNVSVLVAIMVYYLRQPLKAFVAQRKVAIEKEIGDVARLLQEAKQGLAEVSRKITDLEIEIHGFRKEAEAQGTKLKSTIIADSAKSAAQIVADAKLASQSAIQDAKATIIKQFVDEILVAVETEVKRGLNSDSKQFVQKQFSNSLESAK